VQGASLPHVTFANDDFVANTAGSTFDITMGATTGATYTSLRSLTAGRSTWGNLILQQGGGRVGIGTDSPPEDFAIGATSSVAGFSIGSADTQIFLRYNNYFSGTAQVSDATKGTASISLGRSSDGVITFNTAAAGAGVPTEAMRIEASGNVGIGTSPSFPLHVSGSSTNYVMSETTGTGTSSGFRLKGDASADFTLFTTQGTNQFAIYDNANSAERMRIDSQGRVGIKTDNPTSLLHIFDGQGGSSAQTDLLTLQTERSDFGSGGSSILFFDTESPPATSGGNASSRGRIKAYTENADEFQTDFRFSLSDRSDSSITSISADATTITVIHTASVGLGVEVGDYVTIQSTTNFNEDFAVTGVDSNTQFTIAATGYEGFAEETSGNVAKSETFDRMVITGEGNVGIGTALPTNGKLVIEESGTSVGSTIRLIGTNTSGSASQVSHITSYQPAGGAAEASALDFKVRGTDPFATPSTVMTLLGGGNVGIGTGLPDSPLEIQAATNSSSDTTYLKLFNAGENVGHIDFENGNGSLARITGTKEGSGASANEGILTFSTAFDASLTERMRIDSSGNLLVGGTSYQEIGSFSVKGTGDFVSVITSGVGAEYLIGAIGGVSNGYQISIDTSDNQIYKWHTAATPTMTLDASGNLLVGTTSTAVGSSTTEEGFTYIAGQDVQVARENGTVAVFNRWGTIPAGTVVSIKSDGAEVGSIGTFNEDLVLGTGVVGLRMNDGGNTVAPHRMDTNNVADNFVDLGNASGRWKDLYLSNAVYANQLTVNQPKPYTPAHFKAIGGITGPTDVLTIETYRSDVDDAFTGGSIVFVNSDTNSAGQARIKVGSANNVAPIGLNNEVVQSFIFETSTQGTATTSNIDGNATTITVTHTAASLVVGQRIAITAGTYAGSYTIDTVLSSTQFTIADTAHNLAADTTSRTVQYGIPRDSMIIRSDGHVGMGKAINPRADLHVQAVANTLDGGTTTVRLGAGDNGDGNMTNILQFSETGDTNGGMIYGYSIYNDGASGTTDNGLVFRRHENDDVGSTVLYLARNSNRVGINDANPNATLEVTGEDITDTPGDEKVHTIIGGARHHLDFKEVRTAAPSVTGNWDNTTYKLQMRVDGTEHQSIDFVSDNAFLEHIDIRTGNEGFSTRFHQNGNVGIGTSVPGEALHVFRNVNSEKGIIIQNSNTGNAAAAIIKLNANGNNFYIKNWGDGTATANLTEFSSEATGSDFAFMPNNNVGIGTTNPTSTLHVEKDTNDTNPLVLLKSLNPAATEGEVLRLLSSGRGGATVDIDIFSVDNADGQLFTIRNNGNVGIGVVPEHWGTAYDVLQVGAAASLSGSTDTSVAFLSSNAYFDVTNSRWEYISNDFASQYQQINGTHVFSTAATGVANNATNFVERLSVSQNGYVSINGTSGPSLFGTVASAATTSFTEIYSFDITLYGGAKFIVTIEDGSDRQIVELLVVHNGTNAFSTQYGSVLTTGSELATFDVDVNGNNVRLLASGHDASTHEYHTSAHLMAL